MSHMNELGIDPYDSFLKNKVETFMNQYRNSRSPDHYRPSPARHRSRSRSPDYNRTRDRSRSPEYRREQPSYGSNSNRIVNNSMRNWLPQQSCTPEPQYVPQQQPQYVPHQQPQYLPQARYAPQQQPQYVPSEPQYVPHQQPQYVPSEPQYMPHQQPQYVPQQQQQYVPEPRYAPQQQPQYVPQARYVSEQPEYIPSEPRYVSQHSEYVQSEPRYVRQPQQQSVSQNNEPKKDRMGHFIIAEYNVVADFVLSVRNRKRKDIIESRMNEAVSAIQRTIALTNTNKNKNIKIPDIYSYDISVMHISTTLDFGTRIFWCPNRHSYVFKEASFVPREHPILKMIDNINKKTGDILQNIERKWSERNQSWTVHIGMIGKYNQEQKTKLQKLISQLKATSIATNK